MLLLVRGFHGSHFQLSESFIHGSGSVLQLHTVAHPHVLVCCCPGKDYEMTPTLDLLLQKINSTVLEAQLMSDDSAMTATELFTHLHMLCRRTVLDSAGVDLPQRDKDRFVVMSIGGNDLFGPDAHKVAEWKKDPATESVMLIANAVNLALFISLWTELFPDNIEIIRKISEGIMIAFWDDYPTLLRCPQQHPQLHSNDKASDLHQAVHKLLESHTIEEVSDPSLPGYYSQLFLVPEPDGTFCPIINLKKLNLSLVVPSFKMETLFSIIAALQPQQWITKIDLKDTYQLTMTSQHQEIRFVISGKTYQFRVLPVWAIGGTKRFHLNIGSGSPTFENQRDQISCLSRRLYRQGRQSRTLFSTCRFRILHILNFKCI